MDLRLAADDAEVAQSPTVLQYVGPFCFSLFLLVPEKTGLVAYYLVLATALSAIVVSVVIASRQRLARQPLHTRHVQHQSAGE